VDSCERTAWQEPGSAASTPGPFIVDFCAPRRKLVIEVDGSQHLDQEEYDAQRTVYLEEQGYRVVRFSTRMC
jgi:very-short-patch-repair endonuclease